MNPNINPKNSQGDPVEDSNAPLFTLRIASQLSKLPAHSIRQYIDEGLIIPYKLESRRHLFSHYDIERLKMIRKLIHEKGLNFAGIRALFAMIPCWSIRDCSKEDRNSCGAFSEDFQPCWTASQKGRECRNVDCRECEVYRILNFESGIKSAVTSII